MSGDTRADLGYREDEDIETPAGNPGEVNPAAERLRARRHVLSLMQVNPGWVGLNGRTPEQYAEEVLDAALLHERRATVDPERLALALRAVYGHYESSIGVALIRAQDVIRQYEALDATASEEEARHG